MTEKNGTGVALKAAAKLGSMSAEDAQGFITGAGLSVYPVGGDSAPSHRLRYTVQSQIDT